MNPLEKDIDRAIFDVISPLKNLPEYVFLREYDEFLFFDIDISTNQEFIQEMERAWKLTLATNRASVFLSYSSKSEAATEMAGSQDWVTAVDSFRGRLYKNKLHGGIIVMPRDGGWVIFQKNPVDVGVFAINTNELKLRQFMQAVDKSWFIDSTQICRSLTDSESELTAALGRGWLEELAINYCISARN